VTTITDASCQTDVARAKGHLNLKSIRGMSDNPRALPILTDLVRLISFEIEAAVKENDLELAADLEAERDQTVAALETLTRGLGGTKGKRQIAIQPVRKVPKDLAAVEEAALVRLLRQILREERRKKGAFHL
jgi:hypothetical protein